MAIRVRAKRLGVYAGQRRYPDDEFPIERAEQLGSWMEIVADPAPQREDAATAQHESTNEKTVPAAQAGAAVARKASPKAKQKSKNVI